MNWDKTHNEELNGELLRSPYGKYTVSNKIIQLSLC